jgi:hypothetical protein
MKRIICSLFLAGIFSLVSKSQPLNIPPPSLPQYVKQDFGFSSIELSYSRPGVKGRTIFGDLVPYGKVWRTGANNATTISFGDDVIIGGKKVPAGKYGLLTIPGPKEWTLIISRQLDVTNPANYKEDQDVVRVNAPVTNLDFSVESFSIIFANLSAKSCELELMWSKVAVKFPIEVADLDAKIMAQIDNSMNKDNKPYFQSAMYYMESGKNLEKALEWFTKATDQNPDAFFIFYQKARCEAKLGRKQDAMATSRKSLELSKKANNSDYVALNEKLMESLK